MDVIKFITAALVFLTTLASAFAGTSFHWHGYGPGLFGGYNVMSVQDGNTRYGIVTTPDTINGGYTQCRAGRCDGAAIGMRRDTITASPNGQRTYGGWHVTDVSVRNPSIYGHVYGDTTGGYSGNIRIGHAGWYAPTYASRGYYYPPYLAQPDVYARPDVYGNSFC